MKETYEKPEVSIVRFELEDIISSNSTIDVPGTDVPDPGWGD